MVASREVGTFLKPLMLLLPSIGSGKVWQFGWVLFERFEAPGVLKYMTQLSACTLPIPPPTALLSGEALCERDFPVSSLGLFNYLAPNDDS